MFLDWASFRASGAGLFVWEAFVSGGAKRDGHAEDAEVAVEAFLRLASETNFESAIPAQDETYSLIGAALLRTGWASDRGLLSRPCIVVRA
ncbi:MAG: hypothetical protein K6T86_19610 [Pirellulales bacterium]|nr:hypothetical protein [Pirellulales bacterium]